MAAGRAAAATGKAKQERLLEELRISKKLLQPHANVKQDQVQREPDQVQDRPSTLWSSWVIAVAGLAGILYLCSRGLTAQGQSSGGPTAQGQSGDGPTAQGQPVGPPSVQQLKASTDPHYTE